MPCKGSILTAWNGGPAKPVSVFAGSARPASVWAGNARPVSGWAGCESTVLESISPAQGARGDAAFVILTGRNFGVGATIIVSGGGVVASNILVVDGTTIVATLNISIGAAETIRDVAVVQGGVPTNSVPFTVTGLILPPGIATGPSFWQEADYGVVVANGAGIVNKGDWAGRGIAAGSEVYKDPLVPNAPIYRSSGLFGTALPYMEFTNDEGLSTDLVAGLGVTKSTTFLVGYRTLADANSCLWMQISSRMITLNIQDQAASAYLARANAIPMTVIRESSYQQAAGWIPKNVRFLIRHEYGGSHATHRLFLNGALQALPTQLNTGVGLIPEPDGLIRLGWRDPALPAFAMEGGIMAAIQIPDLISGAEIAAWETYLGKWFLAPPPVPVNPYLGPITFAGCTRLQVTAGQNILVDSNSKNNTGIFPDYRQYECVGGGVVSSSRYNPAYGPTIGGDGILVFRFPNSITSFKMTRLVTPGVIGGGVTFVACDDYSVIPDPFGPPINGSKDGSIINYKKSIGQALPHGIQEDMEIVHAPGFKCLVVFQTTLPGGKPSQFRDPLFKLL